MSILEIRRMGDPILRQVAQPVDFEEMSRDELDQLVSNMSDTMREAGGVGIAAPQVGQSVQIAIVEVGEVPTRYGSVPPIPLTVFINPKITTLDDQVAGHWEGCLSVPGLRGWVQRPQLIQVDYLTTNGEAESMQLQGFLATVIQHELDHLDGKLFIDRMQDLTKLCYETEHETYWQDFQG